jgi:hypothetical protein
LAEIGGFVTLTVIPGTMVRRPVRKEDDHD